MTSTLAAAYERAILSHRLMPIESAWADEIIFPSYDGLSIRNLAHTVVRLLDGAPKAGTLGTAPLDPRLWEHHQGAIKRVVVFISDGLGWRLLQSIVEQDPATAQIVADLVGEGSLTPITSIAPSTTAAALPCIWSGASPAATGLVGTRLFLREFGVLASMLHFWPLSGRHRADVLEEWGLGFDSLLPVMTLGERLRAKRIPTYLLLQKDLFGSGLSRVMHRGIKHISRHIGFTDLWISLRQLLQETRGQRSFVSIYWGAVDGISHLHGTVTEQSIAEVRRQLADLRDTLAAPDVADGHTLFLLAADHGHTPVPDHVNLAEHPPLLDALRCAPAGEGRFTLLYLRHGFQQQVADYVSAHLADQVAVIDPADALAAGLFGPEPPHAETAARLGDLVLVARQGVTIGDRARGHLHSLSRHGGLSADEMLVPLLMRAL